MPAPLELHRFLAWAVTILILLTPYYLWVWTTDFLYRRRLRRYREMVDGIQSVERICSRKFWA